MARFGTYRVRVYDSRIVAMHEPGGQTYEEAVEYAYRVKGVAIMTAPARTTNLMRSHAITNTGRQPLYTIVDVRNDADYALFVHEGTQGPIYSKVKNVLRMRPAPHSDFPFPTFHESVDGQTAQPWLQEAADIVRLGY